MTLSPKFLGVGDLNPLLCFSLGTELRILLSVIYFIKYPGNGRLEWNLKNKEKTEDLVRDTPLMWVSLEPVGAPLCQGLSAATEQMASELSHSGTWRSRFVRIVPGV